MSQLCEVLVSNPSAITRRGEPITVGVPLPEGRCSDITTLSLEDLNGDPVPLQARALDTWADGSLRWVLADFQADCESLLSRYVLLTGRTRAPRGPSLFVEQRERSIAVETGVARFVFERSCPFPLAHVSANGRPPFEYGSTRLVVEDIYHRTHEAVTTEIVVEESGPLRACIRVHGALPGHRQLRPLEVFGRIHLFAGSPTMRCHLTVRNTRAARHRGGFWELGDPGSMFVRDVSLHVGIPRDEAIEGQCSTESGRPFEPSPLPIHVYQDSSGGANWDSRNHVNRFGEVPNSLRGYRAVIDGSERNGLRASPIIAVTGPHPLAAFVQEFWENCPKSIELTAESLRLGLWPREYADVHEIGGGEQKTHTFSCAFGQDSVSAEPLVWCRSRLRARLSPESYSASSAVPYLLPAAEDSNADYVALVDQAIAGPSAFVNKRDVIDEYGWRHFGDLYADHEGVRQADGPPLISHYNNQYDAIAGFAIQFMRSGDYRWWDLLEPLANHVVDIDIYHTTDDRSAYNGGLFWHTFHYVDAGKSAHRSYPRAEGAWGGGPSNEHDYSTGLMLCFFLTGDERYREAMLGLARWVLDMDDGRQTVFGWFASGDTGWATSTFSPEYHGPGRGAAYSLTTLLNAWRLTGKRTFIEKAEQIIRRCIHPADDIDARSLLDVERRWSYTVFLQALGRYLGDKREKRQYDDTYAYARESLLSYARWMAEHEEPYLDRPEKLEYPTETWAAQDIRKSDVFTSAAWQVADRERARFLERADFFFDASVRTLARMDTRGLTRPIVIMLGNGYIHAWAQKHAAQVPNNEDRSEHLDFGSPERFVPLKPRAIRRLKAFAATALVILGILSVATAIWLARAF